MMSVVILHYNRPRELKRVLRTIPPECEIIVVDDGSDHRPSIPGHVKLIINDATPKNGPRAASCRNMGARAATTDYILFLDDDVIPHPLCFRAHHLALQIYDVSIGLLPHDKLNPYTDPRTQAFISMDIAPWRICQAGNLAIRRAVFEDVGGFDEEYDGSHGWEDTDLGIRLYRAGHSFVFNHLAIAQHPNEQMAFLDRDAVSTNFKLFRKKWGDII